MIFYKSQQLKLNVSGWKESVANSFDSLNTAGFF